MTLRDTEVIELLADKPELLAIADAVSATQREAAMARRRRRRIAVRAGIVTAAAAAAIIAVLAAPQGRPGVLGRALAAIGNGRILHVVTESQSGLSYVDLKTGHRTAPVLRQELWADRQLDHFHLVLSLDGRLLGDLLLPQDGGASGASPSNPAFVALWTGYREALRNGTAKLVGRGTVRGRPVYWLRFEPPSPDEPRFDVAVDARTYEPVLNRTYANGRHFDQRVLVAKTIPYRPAEFRRRGPSLFSGSGSSSSSGTSSVGPVGSSAPPTTVVRAPWLTAGKTVLGLKLRSADPLEITSDVRGKRRTIKGLELTYGAGQPFLATTIDELPRPDDPNAWSHIPVGSMQVQSGEESGSGGNHTLWTGKLRKHGLFITIETLKGERALLEIARALHLGRR